MRLVVCVFAFLGFAFYHMSGGAAFDPEATRAARVEERAAMTIATAAPVAEPEVVQALEIEPVKLNIPAPTFDVAAEAEPVQEEIVAIDPTPSVETRVAFADTPSNIILPSLIVGSTAPVPQPQPVEVAEVSVADRLDVRSVSGSRVNVRGGPGTNYSVVNRLVRGDQVEILEDPGDGWVMLRPTEGGPVGWMAAYLLSEG